MPTSSNLNAESSPGIALTAATSTPLLVPNQDRNDLRITADPGNTTPVLLLLYNVSAAVPVASATSYHVAVLAAGAPWNGRVGDTEVWQGGVVAFSTAAARVSIASV